MSISSREETFGEIKEENETIRQVQKFTLSNGKMELQVISYGATITSLKIPDKTGKLEDVVMGFDELIDYVNHHCYFGCTVGRVANRIANAQFKIDNKTHFLAKSSGSHHLHGGRKGLDKVVWNSTMKDNQIVFHYTSPSGEENYPGDLDCHVTFELTSNNEVIVHYEATTTLTTPVNFTNHSYFNLAGHDSGNIYDHVLYLNADNYTPVDKETIPTGEVKAVASTEFDLRQPKSIARLLEFMPEGYDHNFCVNGTLGAENLVGSLYHPKSGRFMEIHSTQPGVQFYTANNLPTDESLRGKNGKYYKKHGAVCLETQNYPNALNQPNFPNSILHPDDIYRHTTKFAFSVR